jgi:hypothetical protein
MSKNAVILLVVLCAAVAGLISFSKLRSKPDVASPTATVTEPGTAVPTPAPVNDRIASPSPRPTEPRVAVPVAPSITTQAPLARTTIAAPGNRTVTITPITEEGPVLKPLPQLEKDYSSTTNRDARLDIIMDITENPSAEAVQTLARLFDVETDPELKVDLLDSLLGIEGFKDEKLVLLTKGAAPGLPNDVRQSAIDGLIDLDDRRVIPVLNGLLNDPDPEIREGAKDALELLQSDSN